MEAHTGVFEECVSCYAPTQNTVQPCAHSMCEPCAAKWVVAMDKRSCPLCRGIVVRIGPSPEEGLLVHGRTVWVVGKEVRVSVASIPSRMGVCVVAVAEVAAAYAAGIRRGDILTHINDIPLHAHDQAISIIDRALDVGHPFSVRVAPKKAKKMWSHRFVRRRAVDVGTRRRDAVEIFIA